MAKVMVGACVIEMDGVKFVRPYSIEGDHRLKVFLKRKGTRLEEIVFQTDEAMLAALKLFVP